MNRKTIGIIASILLLTFVIAASYAMAGPLVIAMIALMALAVWGLSE